MSLSDGSRTRRALLLSALSLGSVPSCSNSETFPITHVAQVNLDPKQYPTFIEVLDAEMQKIGLRRFGAAPGLKETVGREVFYGNYRPSLKDNWWFLSVDDIIKSGRLELRAYATSIKGEGARTEALNRVAAVLQRFGASLQDTTASEKSGSQGKLPQSAVR